MANVRIDSQGVPKGPVYEETTPIVHRSGLTAADPSDPTSASAGVDCSGYRSVRFDLDTSGCTNLTALKVQLLVWDATAGKYFRGCERSFGQTELAANPIPSLEAEVRGATVFLKVVSATATSLSISAYASLS
ncbi:MAG: hypothetical protein MUP14_02430 [Dehalococcoidia bacterium]|nr:hypothetical protein [Dehalococcoidia bacterium]